MNYTLHHQDHSSWLEMSSAQLLLTSESEALDWIALCGELGVDCLLAYEHNLPETFFDLRSGLAGSVLLKFSNYRVRLALVISPQIANHGRFGEMVSETNRGNAFRVFHDRQAAAAWLSGDF